MVRASLHPALTSTAWMFMYKSFDFHMLTTLNADWPDRPAGFEQEYPESATRLATRWWLERNSSTELHCADTLSELIQQRYTCQTARRNEAYKTLDDIFHIYLTACEHYSPAVELPEELGTHTLLLFGQ